MHYLNILQWPAMVCSLIAAWLVAARTKSKRFRGFWWFMVSNALWIAWAWPSRAWALIALQVALAVLNVRGLIKNDD